ncbi:putative MFS transporter [Rosellinia necatrix]|uniref:Putative MFS transporter n=1 Tax=Rosellinia necatrix TaxID=77044 RepID=A0A1S8A8B6_ROSNE|nr:putative MFS transporter [Rosellinia necatrix]
MTTRQQAAERSLHNQINILPKRELVIVFAGLALPLLISFVDQNGIGVTLPTIARDLHAEDTISWAGTSSLIANTAFQMLYGRLSDIFGRKFVYLGAIMLLAIATLLCSFAENGTMFYVFRGIAGVGAGGLANLTMIIISDVCTLENKGYYQGIVGAFIGLGNVIGPFLAAAFVARGTWRAFFWTTAPIATLVGVISSYLIPSSQPKAGVKEGVKNIDYGGVILSSAGVTLLLIPISGGGAYFSWTSSLVISMLVLGSSSLLLFVLWEWKLAKLPMVPLDIFRSSAVSILLAQGFLFGSVYQSYLYYLPLYLQNARQYSVTQSAGAIAVLVGSQAVSSIISGYYISQLKKWKLFICSGFLLWTM